MWNPDFCKLFDVPIAEDVLPLVDKVPQTASDVVSQVHESFSVIQGGAVENSALPANSLALLLPAMQVVQPKLPSGNVPLCSPHAHYATVVPMPQKPAAKVGPPAKKQCFASPAMSNKPKPPAKVTASATEQCLALNYPGLPSSVLECPRISVGDEEGVGFGFGDILGLSLAILDNPLFASPMSSNEIAEKCQPTVPKCTQQNTTWAVGLFNQWVQNRNQIAKEKCPCNL